MVSSVLLPVPTPDSYEMIWSFPSVQRLLKAREMRVTLEGTWSVPFGFHRLFFTYPLSLSIQVPSQHMMSLFPRGGEEDAAIVGFADAMVSFRCPSC
jgi:hypothetical protein